MILAIAILLTWADATNPPSATYHVHRAPGACSDFSTFARLTAAPIAAKSYPDQTATGTVCYRVSAVVSGVESDPSAPITVVTKPTAPTGLVATPAPASTPP